MGRRGREKAKQSALSAPVTDYRDADGSVLALRGALTAATRQAYSDTLTGGLHQDDARARAIEMLFERLAVSWTISDIETTRQKELLARYRMATAAEREFVLTSLRTHLAENFPELEVP
jgi:anti-anti-sigma regulatory factor